MSGASAAMRRSSSTATIAALTPTVLRKAEAASAIESNAVYAIMMSPETSAEAKRDAVAAYLTFPGTKEESRERVAAYQAFEEWLQSERERMAQAIIKLTDTQAYSELQAVYGDLNTALLDFEDRMRPLTEIVEALYELRTNDKVIDAFREIKSDKEREAAVAAQKAERGAQLDALERRVVELTNDIQVESGRRGVLSGIPGAGWMGLDGVPASAQATIARKQAELGSVRDELTKFGDELKALEASGPGDSSLGEFAAQKAKLRELVDAKTGHFQKLQEELVGSALTFCEVSKARIGEVRSHLSAMSGQIDHLYDANGQMNGVYAVLTDGINQAGSANQAAREALSAPANGEGLIAKMERETKKSAMDEHVTTLTAAAQHTTETFADLTTQAIRIRTMRDANQSQIDKARVLGTQGVAGVADRLSVVLQAVSGAALGESSALAKDTLGKMVESTNRIAQKETIRVAMGTAELNEDVVAAIENLGDFGEVLRTSTEITRKNLSEVQGNLAKIRELAEQVRGDIHDAEGVASNLGKPEIGKTAAPTASSNPFGLGR